MWLIYQTVYLELYNSTSIFTGLVNYCLQSFHQVWLKDNLRCVSLWMECQQRSICVGVNIVPKGWWRSFVHYNFEEIILCIFWRCDNHRDVP